MKKNKISITSMVKTGGYYYWNWKFPFRHWEEEKIYFSSNTGLYRYNHKTKKYKEIEI